MKDNSKLTIFTHFRYLIGILNDVILYVIHSIKLININNKIIDLIINNKIN